MEYIFWEHDNMSEKKPGTKTVHKPIKKKMKTKKKKKVYYDA